MKKLGLVVLLALASCGPGGGVVETGPVVAEYDCKQRIRLPGMMEVFNATFSVDVYQGGGAWSAVDVITDSGTPSSKLCPYTSNGDCGTKDWAFHLERNGPDTQFAKVTYLGAGRQSGMEFVIPCALTTPISGGGGGSSEY